MPGESSSGELNPQISHHLTGSFQKYVLASYKLLRTELNDGRFRTCCLELMDPTTWDSSIPADNWCLRRGSNLLVVFLTWIWSQYLTTSRVDSVLYRANWSTSLTRTPLGLHSDSAVGLSFYVTSSSYTLRIVIVEHWAEQIAISVRSCDCS